MQTINLVEWDTEFITVEKFMALTDEEKRKIKSYKIIPPRLGGNGFGKIQVKYKVPTYKVAGFG